VRIQQGPPKAMTTYKRKGMLNQYQPECFGQGGKNGKKEGRSSRGGVGCIENVMVGPSGGISLYISLSY